MFKKNIMVLFRIICILFALAALMPLGESVSRTDLIRYFSNISGSHIIAGQHNREPNSDPTKWTRVAHNVTGKFPGLWGGDFLFLPDDVQNRQSMINESIRQWNAGSVVVLSWHACPPTVGESCNWDSDVLSNFSDEQWNSLIQDGGELNTKWKQRIDTILPYFQQLQDAGVVVNFRPLHGSNGGWFWWGGRPGPNGSRRLYEITHDYLSQKLNNLVWVWGVDDQVMDDFEEYFPRADTVDVVSMDVFINKQPRDDHYSKILQVANGKPIALGECGSVPSPEVLERQNRWIWFMVWAEYLKDPDYNSDQSIKETYHWERTLVQGELTVIDENLTIKATGLEKPEL